MTCDHGDIDGGCSLCAPYPYWTVPREWQGQTAVVLAPGPSLTVEDARYARERGAKVLAVKDAYHIDTTADVVYGADGYWWDQHEGVPALGWSTLRVTVAPFAGDRWRKRYGDRFQVLRHDRVNAGLSLDQGELRGNNSGSQAINLAVLFGAVRILLLGFDMRPHGFRHHFFGNRPDRADPPYHLFIPTFEAMQSTLEMLGVSVINCTPESALTAFQQVPLREALPDVPAGPWQGGAVR